MKTKDYLLIKINEMLKTLDLVSLEAIYKAISKLVKEKYKFKL